MFNSAQKDNSTTAHRKTNMAGIVGGAVGGAIVLISLLLLLFFLLKRRKARQTIRNFPKTPMTPALPIQFSGKSPVDEEKGRFTGATAANLAPGSAPYGKLFPVNLSAPHSREGSTASFSGQSGISQISSAPLIAARRSLSERRPSVDAPTLSMPRPPPTSMGNGTPSRVGELQRNVSSPGDRQALRSRMSVDYVSTPQPILGILQSNSLYSQAYADSPYGFDPRTSHWEQHIRSALEQEQVSGKYAFWTWFARSMADVLFFRPLRVRPVLRACSSRQWKRYLSFRRSFRQT
jgi:hypothetical protein